MPEILRSTGAGMSDVDLVMVVETESPNDGSTWIAGSAGCRFDDDHLGIPIIGSLIINVRQWDFERSIEDQHAIIMHEITHTLAFIIDPETTDVNGATIPSRYIGKWTDASGQEYGENNVLSTDTINGVSTQLIITPKVAEKARQYFCDPEWSASEMPGMPLEGHGSAGTKGTHWEKRIAKDEYMIGDIGTADPSYSVFTFALFEDTGWYTVNYDWVQLLNWGTARSREFVYSKCVQAQAPAYPEFCNEVYVAGTNPGCDYNHLHKGFCNLSETSTNGIDTNYQYYGDNQKGGTDTVADNCPYMQPFSNGNCRGHGATTTDTDARFGETIGVSARCITGQFTVTAGTQNFSLCLDVTTCTTTDATIKFVATGSKAETTVTWPFGGGQVTVPGYDGYVNCPASDVLWRDVPCINACRGAGICTNSHCVWNDGYGDEDCGITCDASCKSCSGTQSNDCTDCYEGKILQSGSCVDIVICTGGKTQINNECICPSGTYDNNGTWAVCHADCKTCTGPLDADCSSCFTKYALTDENKCECADGYFYQNEDCLQCNFSCKTCTGPLDSNCLTCNNDSIFDSDANTCGCKSCSCSTNAISRNSSNGNCECIGSSCLWDGGFFFDSTNFEWVACDASCSNCENTSYNWISWEFPKVLDGSTCVCSTDMSLDVDGTCKCNGDLVLIGSVCGCENGFFRSEDLWSACDVACSTWTESSNNCNACNTGYLLQGTKCEANTFGDADDDATDDDDDDDNFTCDAMCIILVISIPGIIITLAGIFLYKWIQARNAKLAAVGPGAPPPETVPTIKDDTTNRLNASSANVTLAEPQPSISMINDDNVSEQFRSQLRHTPEPVPGLKALQRFKNANRIK